MTYPNKTAAYFYKLSYIVFFLGSPNFWIEDLNLPDTFYKTYRRASRYLNVLFTYFIVFELGSFITQKNLTKTQEADLMVYAIAHPIMFSYTWILSKYDKDVQTLFRLILRLKSIYNDKDVEEKWLKKSKRDSRAIAFTCIMAVTMHTYGPLMTYIKSEGTFTTLITAWPLVDDPSAAAHAARVFNNIMFWVFVSRVIASYMLVISLVTSISHQYMNLQSYFHSIEAVFEDENTDQCIKEVEYEKSFKLGIELHTRTIECVDQFRHICGIIYSAQIVFVITTLVFLMSQMMEAERNIVSAATTAITVSTVMFGAGFFLWNAGDITEEAAALPTAMYCSGWQHCRGHSARRVRKLVTIAMAHAQKPVYIKGLGMMIFSYESYVSLVKFSYSVFSVVY
uniref:Odorant receptor n=1 Tax=Semiothisa cinerearia TaxID=2249628 RepID=A0A889XLA7_9NEOP|nr:odorant receptor [Semiothisa cinerearia]